MSKDLDEIKESGEKLLKKLSRDLNTELSFNKQTIIWLDAYIAGNRDVFSEEEKRNLSYSIGYILGETIILEYGGRWIFSNDFSQWVVDLGSIQANPIGKTQKYLNDYLDSIESFFNVIGISREDGGFGFEKSIKNKIGE
jgi:hypothetical protein